MKLLKFFVILSIIFFPASNTMLSQGDWGAKYRLAKSFEKSGAMEDAARLYKELLDRSPGNTEIFQAVVRTYKALSRYTDLLDIIELRLKGTESFGLLALHGEMLWRIGDYSRANQSWKKALDEYGESHSNFLEIANIQSKLRLIEKAINTLKIGREKLGKEDAFADELSQLYIALGDYKNGAEEIINTFYQNRNLARAQGQLYALMTDDSAASFIYGRMNREVESNPGHLGLLSLHVFVQKTLGRYEDALETTVKIDEIKKANGRDIIRFADLARREGKYEISLKAYGYVIDNTDNSQFLPTALFGYARALEQKFLVSKKISPKDAQRIIERYRHIIDKFPRRSNAADSRYRIAVLALDHLGDVDMAKQELHKLVRDFPMTRVSAVAYNMLGRIATIDDDFELAREFYAKVVRNYRKTDNNEYEKALYKIAELNYFLGEIDTAKVLFREISNRSKSPSANDALDKIILMERNKEFTKALGLFAEAELRELQGQMEDAIELYEQAASFTKGEDLYDRSCLRISEILFSEGNFLEARQKLAELQENSPKTLFGDYVLFLIAECFRAEGQKQEAISHYSKLLADYPQSIYLQKARDNIRALRGEKI